MFKNSGTSSHEQRVALSHEQRVATYCLHVVLLLLPSPEPKPDLPKPEAYSRRPSLLTQEESKMPCGIPALSLWPADCRAQAWTPSQRKLALDSDLPPEPSSSTGKGGPAARGYRGGTGSDRLSTDQVVPRQKWKQNGRSSGHIVTPSSPFITPLPTAGDQVAPDQTEYLTPTCNRIY